MRRKTVSFLAFGDLHFGYSRSVSPSGKLVSTPVHNTKAFRAMLEFARDFKPDIVLFMGDNFDMRPVNRHGLDKPKEVEVQRLVEVYEKSMEFFIKPFLDLAPTVHWFDGNHEAWVWELEAKYPGISGMLDPVSYLGLRKDVIYHPYGEIYRLGDVYFAHTVVRSSKNCAKAAVDKVRAPVRIWHFHTYQAYTQEAMKNHGYQTGVAVPCMCNRGPDYDPFKINHWVNGFLYGWVEPNGDFHDNVVIIWKDKFIAGGKLYDGRKKA